MKIALILACVAPLAAAVCLAQEPCSKPVERARAAEVAGFRGQLRAIKLPDDGADVPASAQRTIPELKDALAEAARAVLACHPGELKPKAVESEIAALLHANPPQPVPNSVVYKGNPRYTEYLSDDYGSNLLVTVAEPRPQLLSVQFQFHIGCGDDTVWMLFEREGSQWREKLLWQAPPYEEINGAFGDFFVSAILPESSRDGWRVVAAHGRPWCTSRFSGFDLDVLAPSGDPGHPRVVWHTEREYSRGDFEARLRATDDTFELRLHDDEMHFEMDGFERLVVYRYRVSDEKVTRLEPVAANARGFVQEWLSMPWEEAAAQSDPAQSSKLQTVHKLYEGSYKETNAYTSWGSGPVQACAVRDHFQVTMTTERERMVPGKPGGDSTPGATYYFQLQQDNGYRLLAITAAPDPTCSGPDLMQKKP